MSNEPTNEHVRPTPEMAEAAKFVAEVEAEMEALLAQYPPEDVQKVVAGLYLDAEGNHAPATDSYGACNPAYRQPSTDRRTGHSHVEWVEHECSQGAE